MPLVLVWRDRVRPQGTRWDTKSTTRRAKRRHDAFSGRISEHIVRGPGSPPCVQEWTAVFCLLLSNSGGLNFREKKYRRCSSLRNLAVNIRLILIQIAHDSVAFSENPTFRLH